MRALTNALTRLARRLLVGIATSGSVEDQVHCLLGLAGGYKYESGVAPENLQPGLQIRAAVVDGLVLDAGDSAQERSPQLRNELFSAVVLVSERFRVHER